MRADVRTLRDRIANTRAKLERLEAERDELLRVAARKGIDPELLAQDAGLNLDDFPPDAFDHLIDESTVRVVDATDAEIFFEVRVRADTYLRIANRARDQGRAVDELVEELLDNAGGPPAAS